MKNNKKSVKLVLKSTRKKGWSLKKSLEILQYN